MIQTIVVQEMYHFALAANMLVAIKGTLSVADSSFLPTYPTRVLPGEITLDCEVDLQPLSKDQLAVFMEIEKPEFPPIALVLAKRPATIGAFYDTIAAGFRKVNPDIDPAAPYVVIQDILTHMPIPAPKNGQILAIDDAIDAIDRIKQEGEGTEGSPEQPPDGQRQLAHYYVFKQIYRGRKLKPDPNGCWIWSDEPITLPTAPFSQSTATPDPSADFNAKLSSLLISLQNSYTAGGAPPSIAAMVALENAGKTLIKNGVRPEFIWPAS
jgi:hypothetical protein